MTWVCCRYQRWAHPIRGCHIFQPTILPNFVTWFLTVSFLLLSLYLFCVRNVMSCWSPTCQVSFDNCNCDHNFKNALSRWACVENGHTLKKINNHNSWREDLWSLHWLQCFEEELARMATPWTKSVRFSNDFKRGFIKGVVVQKNCRPSLCKNSTY